MPDFEISRHWKICEIDQESPLFQEMLELRNAILRRPLGLHISESDLVAESDQIHFVLVNRESQQVEGCAMLVEKSATIAKVRQVAVVENLRGKGLGQFLMEGVEAVAQKKNFSEIHLHARDLAVPFYERIRYEIVGDSFVEVGLPHFLMQKKIN